MTETGEQRPENGKRWLALYAGVLLFLVLQILLYAWFTETWK